MTAADFAPRCTARRCKENAISGGTRCFEHADSGRRRDSPLRKDWELTCCLCERGSFTKLSDDEARAERPQRCPHPFCGGRMLLSPIPLTLGSRAKPEPKPDNTAQLRLYPRDSAGHWTPAA